MELTPYTKHTAIRWGIIGCGDVTEIKSGPALQLAPDSSLVAVMRRDGDKAKDYAYRHQVPRWYNTADALINDPDINAIYIATPPHVHENYALKALEAGKYVYVEKPMSLTVASCIRMKEATDTCNGKLVVAHYRRALPMFLSVKELLAAKKIGDPRSVRISLMLPDASQVVASTETNWRTSPEISGGGILYDLAPHQLDLLVYFFGAPLGSFGYSTNQAGFYTTEDIVCSIAHLPGNLLFSGQWCFTVDRSQAEDIFEITGSDGRMRFAVFGHTVTIEKAEGTETLTFTPPKHIQQPMITAVVDYFLDRGPNPCSASDAIHSMQLIETFAYSNRFI